MPVKRMAALLALAILSVIGLMSCGPKDSGMVDAPLMKNAPPPPPIPNKPTVTPTGGGGQG